MHVQLPWHLWLLHCPLVSLSVIDRAWGLFPRTLPAGPSLLKEAYRTLWDLWPGFLAALGLSWLLFCLGELGGPWGRGV